MTASDTICVSLHFFQCVSTSTAQQVGSPLSMYTLILPGAVPLQVLFLLPGVPCPSVFLIQMIPTGIISIRQKPDDFRLHHFYIFDFKAHIVCTSHFIPSHNPPCFVIELAHVCVFTQLDKGSLRQGLGIYSVLYLVVLNIFYLQTA